MNNRDVVLTDAELERLPEYQAKQIKEIKATIALNQEQTNLQLRDMATKQEISSQTILSELRSMSEKADKTYVNKEDFATAINLFRSEFSSFKKKEFYPHRDKINAIISKVVNTFALAILTAAVMFILRGGLSQWMV